MGMINYNYMFVVGNIMIWYNPKYPKHKPSPTVDQHKGPGRSGGQC